MIWIVIFDLGLCIWHAKIERIDTQFLWNMYTPGFCFIPQNIHLHILLKLRKISNLESQFFFKTFRILNYITIVKTYEFKAYGTCTFICFASKQAMSYVMWIFMSEVDCFSRKCFIIYIGYPSLKKNANLVLMIYCNYFIHLLYITINNYDFSYSILIHVCND